MLFIGALPPLFALDLAASSCVITTDVFVASNLLPSKVAPSLHSSSLPTWIAIFLSTSISAPTAGCRAMINAHHAVSRYVAILGIQRCSWLAQCFLAPRGSQNHAHC